MNLTCLSLQPESGNLIGLIWPNATLPDPIVPAPNGCPILIFDVKTDGTAPANGPEEPKGKLDVPNREDPEPNVEGAYDPT